MPANENNYKHFIDLDAFDKQTLSHIIKKARELKEEAKSGTFLPHLKNKQIALVFEKPSTRTRVSFEVGMSQLGGNAVVMDSKNSQLGQGEAVSDTARVLSRYVDVVMVRCYQHEMLKEMAEFATVPVINGLTDYSHPCQVMADLMTFEEHKGSIEGKIVSWIGDSNNVARSWIHAAQIFGFEFRICCPEEFKPATPGGDNIKVMSDPKEAAKDADLILTDTWVSMGDENGDYKRNVLQPYQVSEELMSEASDTCIFMHCLPAHRGEEVTDAVIDGIQSVVWDEAENRLHVQKAIILWCLGKI